MATQGARKLHALGPSGRECIVRDVANANVSELNVRQPTLDRGVKPGAAVHGMFTCSNSSSLYFVTLLVPRKFLL